MKANYKAWHENIPRNTAPKSKDLLWPIYNSDTNWLGTIYSFLEVCYYWDFCFACEAYPSGFSWMIFSRILQSLPKNIIKGIFTQWRLFKLLQCSDSYYILDIICLMRYFNIIIDLNLWRFWIGLSDNKSESNLKAYFFWNEKG